MEPSAVCCFHGKKERRKVWLTESFSLCPPWFPSQSHFHWASRALYGSGPSVTTLFFLLGLEMEDVCLTQASGNYLRLWDSSVKYGDRGQSGEESKQRAEILNIESAAENQSAVKPSPRVLGPSPTPLCSADV